MNAGNVGPVGWEFAGAGVQNLVGEKPQLILQDMAANSSIASCAKHECLVTCVYMIHWPNSRSWVTIEDSHDDCCAWPRVIGQIQPRRRMLQLSQFARILR